MLFTQISAYVENYPGALLEVLRVFSDAGINCRSLTMSDTTDFGILRVIVSDPDKAAAALKAAGVPFKKTPVFAVEVEDRPGATVRTFEVMNEADIFIEYTYAFLVPSTGKAYLVMRVDKSEEAVAALKKAGVPLLAPDTLYNM